MSDPAPVWPGPSTGVPDLDDALHGLYWGDNVVWEVDQPDAVAPFFDAIAALSSEYHQATYVTLTTPPEAIAGRFPGSACWMRGRGRRTPSRQRCFRRCAAGACGRAATCCCSTRWRT